LLICFGAGWARAGGLPDVTDPVAGMGVNIHFYDARPGELEMLSRAGFQWVRMDFHWDKTEPMPGMFDFSAQDRLLANLDKLHIHALFILDYTNRLYDGGKPSCTDEGRAAFSRWAVAAVKHFKGRGVIWEVWNEPNGSWFWQPKANADDYAKLAFVASASIHQAAPDETIIGPALAGSDPAFLETVLKTGVLRYRSGVSIHPYSQRDAPEKEDHAYAEVKTLIAKYAPPGKNIPVICGECGYSTTSQGVREEVQGQFLARQFLNNMLEGIPLTIWYDWSNDGTNPQDKESNFGIVRNAYQASPPAPNAHEPKPAYLAAQAYAKELSGFHLLRRLTDRIGSDAYVLVFTRGAETCFVAWTTSPSPHAVQIPTPDGSYEVTTYDGKSHTVVKTTAGALTLTLDGGPRYVRLKP
jgi:hypothetical protein